MLKLMGIKIITNTLIIFVYLDLRLCLISVQKSIELLSRAKKPLILLGSQAKIVFDFSSEEYRTIVSSQETIDIVRISG